MKKIFLFLGLCSIIISVFVSVNAACGLDPACSNDETVFRMSSSGSNAHGAIYSYGSYSTKVCCKDGTTGHSCDGANQVIKLSATENAQAEQKTGTSYGTSVCFGGFVCSYRNSCNANEQCLASMSAVTNSHLGACDSYTTKICCEDCAGIVSGVVRDTDGNLMQYADISVIDVATLQEKYSGQTNSQGAYAIAGVTCGQYHISASKQGYLSATIEGISVARSGATADFTGSYAMASGTTCMADCSYLEDDRCHAECDGESVCRFNNTITKGLCDLAKIGWEKNYNSSHAVTCCSGGPVPNSAVTPQGGGGTSGLATCLSENLVEVTRVLQYKGKPINVVVVVCR